ncbi:MAG: FAD-dependent oxidoreductase [Verrucomicrobiota bacterium]
MIRNIVVLGAGSAGLIAALTLKRKLPQLEVRVIRSPEIGIIGVGEGTTAAFPRHFFEYLKLDPADFYQHAEPTWKLGIKFLWGPTPEFYYSFDREYAARQPNLARNNGFYMDDGIPWAGRISAFMAHDKAFPRKSDGTPAIHNKHAFHIENLKLVALLERWCRQYGVAITDGTMERVELEASTNDPSVAALHLKDGERVTADLFVDASGFRSELIGKALRESYVDYSPSLFCDRAVIGGWSRTDEVIKPYTVAETYDAGWAWQIEHEDWINRGYVYSSPFISDEEALAELLRKNPKISNEPRVVRFRSGRYQRNWIGNVVGIGNAVGFVEPLEATALQVVCVESSTLADTLADSLQDPGDYIKLLYNRYNGEQWDEIRDFLAVHYAFNNRLDTPFWHACRADTDLAGAVPIVEFFKENGPSAVATEVLLKPTNSFGIDGYQAMLVGQRVPHGKRYTPPHADLKHWQHYRQAVAKDAKNGLDVRECLDFLRQCGVA